MSELHLGPLKKTLSTLKEGFKEKPNDLERDGIIQRFKYTFELCWKISKKILDSHGIQSDSPKNIFRELAQLEWIERADIWFNFLKARNKTNHIYHQEIAQEVFKVVPEFIDQADKLIKILEAKIK